MNYIIRTWANKTDCFTQQATATALSRILLQGKWKNEILALLNSWIKINNNKFLNTTSILTYYLIADKYPEEALLAIESSLARKEPILSLKLNDIAVKVYRKNLDIFMTYINGWIKDERKILRQQAGMWFLRLIKLKDTAVCQCEQTIIVEIISIIWNDPTMPMRLRMQQNITEKIKAWAEEALVVLGNDEKELFARYQKLFHSLCRDCHKNMTYYLEKWQSYREYKQKKDADREGADRIPSSKEELSFFLLIPQGE